MSSSREALQGRFRASLLKRIDDITSMLELLELMPNEPDAKRQVLGELHTLKGEARMLGALALADLTHALEESIGGQEALDFRAFDGALRAMDSALRQDVLEQSDTTLRRAHRLLVGHPTSPPPAVANDVTSSSHPPASSRPPREASELGEPAMPPVPGAAEPSLDARQETAAHRPVPAGVDEQRWVSVEASTVDDLCDRVTALAEGLGRLQRQMLSELDKPRSELGRATIVDSFLEYRQLLEACVDVTWGLRLVRIAPMLARLEQHAKLLAQRAQLPLNVRVRASGVQLERDVVDLVWDSLVHLVRNAIAHGIEAPEERGGKPRVGTLELIAESVGPHVMIVVSDDGRGLDPARLRRAAVERNVLSLQQAEALSDNDAMQLVFRHGFSTEREADELAGRGVGMDVVKEKIEGLGGSVRLHSEKGQGTRVVLIVPFAITKERIIVADSGSGLYGVPVRVVRRILGIEELSLADDKAVRYQGAAIPLRSFTRAVKLPNAASETTALILELGEKLFAVRVNAVVGERELIRRPAEALLARVTGIGASAVLNDGRMVLLLDLSFLERSLLGQSGEAPPKPISGPSKPTRVVVADDSPVVTEMVSELLTSAGLSVEVARDGAQALVAIERQQPDLVITDLEMPNMNGLELLANIRQRSPTLPVIMLTTRGSVEDRRRASAAGANAYVLKSGFRSDVLLDVVGRFLRLR